MLQRCTDCTTLYAADLAACPHCGSTDRTEVGGPVQDEPAAAGKATRARRPAGAADGTAG